MMSAMPSPSRRRPRRTPPAKPGRRRRSSQLCAVPPRAEDAHVRPAAGPGPGDDSASRRRSSRRTPRTRRPEARVVGVEAGELCDTPPADLETFTCGPPQGPAPVMISSTPSPSTSHPALMRILVMIVAVLLAGFGSPTPLRTVAVLVMSTGAAVPPPRCRLRRWFASYRAASSPERRGRWSCSRRWWTPMSSQPASDPRP